MFYGVMLQNNAIKWHGINVFDSLFDNAVVVDDNDMKMLIANHLIVVVDDNDMENAYYEPSQNSSSSAKRSLIVLAINFLLPETQ